MKYEKYKLNELAKIEKVKGKPLSKYEEGETPYVTGSQSNNGVVGYINAPKKDISKGNCIVVDPIKGLCMYQENDFVGRGFSGASINALYIEGMDETSAMFIIAAIKKVSLKVASYSYLFNSNKLAEAEIMLPTLDALDADSPYSSNGYVPDWKYMKDRVAELEKDRVAELENYLIASGLNDYEFGNLLKKMSAPYLGKGRKQDNVSKVRTSEFNLPLINCKYGNNGIMYYGREKDFRSYESVLTIIYNGPPTEGQVYYQEKIGVYTDAYIVKLKSKEMSKELGLYLTSAMNQSIHNHQKKKYSRGYKAIWTGRVENDDILLPIQTSHDGKPIIDPDRTYHPDGYIPDWEYMEKYIKATEKEIIKEVVLYKDKVIEKAKEIAGEKEVT